MDNNERDTIRAAAYLAAQQRTDFRGPRASRSGKTRSGKINCTPPNKQCGGRCIPPSWDCRLEGKGTNSELQAHRTDPLAGIASLQRGSKDLARGIVRLNPAQVQRGRSSVIRGVVKLVPGDNLEQKKQLKRQLTQASTPVMAAIGLTLVGLSAHAGLKRGFPSYRNGLGADVDGAASRAVDAVLDRIPGISGNRAARRAAGGAAAGEIATAVTRGSRIQATQSAAAGNLRRIGPLSFRPNAANYEASNLRSSLDTLQARARSGSMSYDDWQRSSVEALYGATSPGTRANGQRGSVFSEHAANEFLVSKFGLRGSGAVGNQGQFSIAARNALVDTQLGERLGAWGQTLQADMRLRRFTGPDGGIRSTDIDRYIREVGDSTLAARFAGMSSAQRNQARTEAHRLMRSAINGTNLLGEARSIRRSLVSEYDTYFAGVAQNMRRNAVASDSPFGDGLTGLARYVGRVNNQPTQILSRDHADLILRNHYHTRVMRLPNDFAIGDGTARRVAQQISRSPDLPDIDSAYRILNENGFPRLSRRAPATGRAPQRLRNLGELTADILARPGNEGMSRAAAQREARRLIERRERGDASPEPVRTDLQEGRRLGKPCGESYIPKAHECSKNKGKGNKTAIATAVVAGTAGLAAAAALSNPELRRRARVNGKLLARDSDRVFRGALKLSSRGVVSGLSSQQVKEGLAKLPDAFQQPARQLIGGAKKAVAAMGLKAEGYQIQDIDVANNFSTWKDKSGTLVSIGSYGDSIVTYVSNNSHSWNGKRVYKIGFNVDQQYDALRDIPRAQASAITSGVKKMTDNHLAKIKDGFLATYPWDGDEYGTKRRSLYRRAGFNDIIGESSQWAQVSDGRIKKMTAAESFVFLAESGERDAPIYKPARKRKDAIDLKPRTDGSR